MFVEKSKVQITKILVLFLLVSVFIDSVNSSKIQQKENLTENIIQIFFQNVTRCIYHFNDDNNTDFITTFLNINYPFIVYNFNYILNNKQEMWHCDGYIITSKDSDLIENIFSTKKKFIFKTNTRVLIFYNSLNDLKYHYLNFAYHHYGIEILLVKPKSDYICTQFQVITFHCSFKTYEIIDVINNVTLSNWSNEHDYIENINNYTLGNWQPVFENRYFNVSFFNCPPYVIYIDNGTNMDGIEFQIMKLLTNEYPVKYLLRDEYDDKVSRAAWRKIVSDIQNNTSEMGLCSLWMNNEWNKMTTIDMTHPYGQVCITFLVHKSKKISESLYIYLALDEYVWISVIIITIVAGMSLTIIAKIGKKLKHWKTVYSNFGTSFLNISGMLLLSPFQFPSASQFQLRFLISTWWILCLMIATCYSAGYTALLTNPLYSKSINTFQDFLINNVHWGKTQTEERDLMINSVDPTMWKLAKQFIPDKTTQEHIYNLKQKNRALLTKTLTGMCRPYIPFLNDEDKKKLKCLKECIYKYYIILGLRRNSPFLNIFNKKITRIMESGIIFHIFTIVNLHAKDSDKVFERISHHTQSVTHSLTLLKIQGAFIVLTIGYTLSFIVFLYEHLNNILFKRYIQVYPYIN